MYRIQLVRKLKGGAICRFNICRINKLSSDYTNHRFYTGGPAGSFLVLMFRIISESKGGEGYIEQFLAYLLLHSDNADFPNILAELEMSLN